MNLSLNRSLESCFVSHVGVPISSSYAGLGPDSVHPMLRNKIIDQRMACSLTLVSHAQFKDPGPKSHQGYGFGDQRP